jgi:hypothetical protein
VEERHRFGVDKAMPRAKNTSPRPRRRLSLLSAIAATLLLLTVGVATAAATSNIEGVWEFDGGQIVIQPENGGPKLEGVVVAPTTFAACVHPVGQQIWKEMSLQNDGSYWGFHQWYKEGAKCVVDSTFLGPTAWRVVEQPNGSRALLVCLSHPGGPQPTIPPGSEGVDASFGCTTSSFTAPTPVIGGGGGGTQSGTTGTTPTGSTGVQSYKETLTFPSAQKCLSGRSFKIHLLEPTYDPFKTVKVTLKGHKIATVHSGKYVVATVNLKGLPVGRFAIKIVATTVLGHHLSGTRTYHTCAKKAIKSKPKKLT